MGSLNTITDKSISLDKSWLAASPSKTTPIAIPNATPKRHTPLTPPPSIRSKMAKSSSGSYRPEVSSKSFKRSISINSIKKNRSICSNSFSSIGDDSSFKSKSSYHPLSNSDDHVPVYDYYYMDDDDYVTESDEDGFSLNSCSTCQSSSRSSNSRFTSQLFASPLQVPPKSNSLVSSISTVDVKPVINASNSSESLIKMLNVAPVTPEPKQFVSNLSSSLSSIKNSVKQNLMAYSLYLSPSITNEVLTTPIPVEKEMDMINKSIIQVNECMDDFITLVPSKAFRNRDERINSNFLRLYAQDYSSRVNKLLPDNYSDEEFLELYNKSEGVKDFHLRFNFYKISNLNRDKLWKNVVLPARFDSCPSASIDHSSYIYTGNDVQSKNSLITLNGNYLPWARANNKSSASIKPSGILHGVKGCQNGSSPSSGVSQPQFTVKGWCNRRWLDISDLDE